MPYQKSQHKIKQAYERLWDVYPLLSDCPLSFMPLTYEDSLYPIPDYPICAIGELTADGEWGSKKSYAFVVEDNYILTCASNCYSHQHGEYPNITFTINSNRKSGHDTYRVKEVFIPQQWKAFSENERNQYNYALLSIENQHSFKDRYGKIATNFVFEEQEFQQLFDSKCLIKKHGNIQLCNWELFQEDQSSILIGGPLLYRNSAVGLICQEEKCSKVYSLRFGRDTKQQFAQWVSVPAKRFTLKRLQSYEMDVTCLKDVEIQPINAVCLADCDLKGCFSFFQGLPFSCISSLRLETYEINSFNQIGNDLYFLKLDKFRDIKAIQICNHKIGPAGCSIIASFSFSNLRLLRLDNNPIGDEGCRHLSKANWPFIGSFYLCECRIGNEGFNYLLQQKRRNLYLLFVLGNVLDFALPEIFENIDLPRIDFLNLDRNHISPLGLLFLRSDSWRILKKLSLNNNYVGNKGCKMIKQSGLALEQLNLNNCLISSVGVKWLCKANLTKMNKLTLFKNSLGQAGCLCLSRANLLNLQDIGLAKNDIAIKGMIYLLQSGWSELVVNRSGVSFYSLILSYERSEFNCWLQR